jgi:hypothetical protein
MSDTRAKNTWSPSRRTLVKGAAWTAPAVVVATAAPAFAATRPPVAPPPDSFGCKYPGNSTAWNKTYRVQICFLNSTSDAVSVTITGVTWEGDAPTYPPTGSTADSFFDPRWCDSDGADPDLVGDNCSASGAFVPKTFNVAAASGGTPGQTCYWVFWKSNSSSQNSMCFTYSYSNGAGTVNTSACTTIHFDPDCGCTTPQPPYAKDVPTNC